MSEAYPESLRDVAKQVARELGQLLQEGVYLALSGPTYETPAEIRAFRTLGADAVGMSTVPEVIAMSQMQHPGARHLLHHQHGRRNPEAETDAPGSDGHDRPRAGGVHRAGAGVFAAICG